MFDLGTGMLWYRSHLIVGFNRVLGLGLKKLLIEIVKLDYSLFSTGCWSSFQHVEKPMKPYPIRMGLELMPFSVQLALIKHLPKIWASNARCMRPWPANT